MTSSNSNPTSRKGASHRFFNSKSIKLPLYFTENFTALGGRRIHPKTALYWLDHPQGVLAPEFLWSAVELPADCPRAAAALEVVGVMFPDSAFKPQLYPGDTALVVGDAWNKSTPPVEMSLGRFIGYAAASVPAIRSDYLGLASLLLGDIPARVRLLAGQPTRLWAGGFPLTLGERYDWIRAGHKFLPRSY